MTKGREGRAASLPRAAAVGEERPAIEGLLDHRESVFLICLGFARNRWDAEELAQETYLRALRGCPDLRDAGRLRAWLFRIARNTCVDHLRRGRLRRLVGLSEAPEPRALATPETLLQDNERHQALRAAVAGMPLRLREVLVLREYGGLSYQDISAALAVEMGTVMSRLYRARAWLARRLTEEAKP
jgi:RNA polymerase sigma-70 factor (ECF subfamily)